MATHEEVKSVLNQFESLRFRQECMNNIEDLNEVINRGEEILISVSKIDFPDVPPYIAIQLVVPYWERARYHSHREYYASGKFQHTKNLDLGIADFSRLLELLEISGEKDLLDKFYLLAAYEGILECRIEQGKIKEAIIDANRYITAVTGSTKDKVAKAYTLRGKCYFLLGDLKKAKNDILVALAQVPDFSEERATALRIKEKIDKSKAVEKSSQL